MDLELEKNVQEQSVEQNEPNRDGYARTAGNYQRDYHNAARPQRPRIHSRSAYSSERVNNNEGGFRPQGFGANLSGGSDAPQRQYRPRFNNNNNGEYQPRGGYQLRKQG